MPDTENNVETPGPTAGRKPSGLGSAQCAGFLKLSGCQNVRKRRSAEFPRFSIVLAPVVLLVDGSKMIGRRIRAAGRWLMRVFGPLAIRIREIIERLWALIGRVLRPVLRPLTALSDLLDRTYERLSAAIKPAADRFYETPLAMGRAWGRFKARVGATLGRFARWVAALPIAQSIRRLTKRIRQAVAGRIGRARASLQRTRAAIRARLSR